MLELARGWRLGPMASQNSSSVSAALLMGRAPRGLGSAPASTSFHAFRTCGVSWAASSSGPG